MLSYVFWHTAQPTVDPTDYERLLVRFHEALGDEAPDGLEWSATYRTSYVPWLESDNPVYEDWYAVRNSAALDELDRAAVTAHRQMPHDEVAAVAGAGKAGLYRLRIGNVDPPAVKRALWLSKPPIESYAEFYRRMQPLVDGSGGALWGRQMVLGPAPEFCLHSAKPQDVPGVTSRMVKMDLVWSGVAKKR